MHRSCDKWYKLRKTSLWLHHSRLLPYQRQPNHVSALQLANSSTRSLAILAGIRQSHETVLCGIKQTLIIITESTSMRLVGKHNFIQIKLVSCHVKRILLVCEFNFSLQFEPMCWRFSNRCTRIFIVGLCSQRVVINDQCFVVKFSMHGFGEQRKQHADPVLGIMILSSFECISWYTMAKIFCKINENSFEEFQNEFSKNRHK